MTAVFELLDVAEGEGGFGCVPGSHTPAGFAQLAGMGLEESEWRREWVDSRWTRRHPRWSPAVPVHTVAARAGTCILFTEKLQHATVPWSGAGERRTIFHKYVPHGMVRASHQPKPDPRRATS